VRRLLNRPIKQIDFAVIDIETTGLCRENDCVVEIAAVKVKNNRIVKEKFHSLVYTEYIPYFATRIHGIDAQMVSGAPEAHEVSRDFKQFIKDCVLVGHNIVSFDMPFLYNAFSLKSQAYCVDTLKMSRLVFNKERSHKLITVAERLGIKNKKYHRALDDAMVTAQVFLEFLGLEKQKFKILKDIIA